jgi:hypothetical protein
LPPKKEYPMPRDPEATAEFVKKFAKGEGGGKGDGEYEGGADDDEKSKQVTCPECGATFTPKE